MATRAEVERLRVANAELSRLVQQELSGLFGSLNLNKPEAARDVLLAFIPDLVAQYGEVASVLAMDWYEEVRAAAGKTAVQALAAPTGIPAAAVEANVRFHAGKLWTPQPADALAALLVQVDKYVKQPGRSTIAYNAERNGSRWMRVPSGPKTCSFCLMLASRSGAWLYTSRDSALFDRKTGEKYHGDCDCQPVEVADPDDIPEGHDGREMFEMYRTSTDAVGTRADTKDILYDMRRRFPDQLKDGVIDPEYLAKFG